MNSFYLFFLFYDIIHIVYEGCVFMKELFFNYRFVRIIVISLLTFLSLLFIVLLFFKLWVPFGGNPSFSDKQDYEKRASNYKNGKFYNEREFKMIYTDKVENKYVSVKDTKPKEEIPLESPNILESPSINKLNITWLGHSTILMNMHGMNLLIDPVFSDYASPIPYLGPVRYSDLPIGVDDLPNIDIVLISHDHYDHLDYKTIKLIDNKVDKYIVPLGVENHLEKWGVNSNKIINMAWWEEITINGLLIGCTPSRHYSSRTMIDKYNTLWASFVLIDNYYKLFISGDSGYDDHFKKIGEKYGNFDISLLDTGQYNTRWKSTHMVPEQSVQAGIDLKSQYIMPIHYGTFKLANHPWDDPVDRFVLESEKKNINYITPKIGETINYNGIMSTSIWWRDIE